MNGIAYYTAFILTDVLPKVSNTCIQPYGHIPKSTLTIIINKVGLYSSSSKILTLTVEPGQRIIFILLSSFVGHPCSEVAVLAVIKSSGQSDQVQHCRWQDKEVSWTRFGWPVQRRVVVWVYLGGRPTGLLHCKSSVIMNPVIGRLVWSTVGPFLSQFCRDLVCSGVWFGGAYQVDSHNVQTKDFQAEHCTVKRWSILFTLPCHL